MEQDNKALFRKGIEYRNDGKLEQAIEVFLEFIKKYPSDPGLGGTYSVLGGIYFDQNDFKNSLKNFTIATQLNPKSELASLGLYLSYIELNEYEKAIEELKRYLDKYPAKLYKDTLEELLQDLRHGYALIFKETIVALAEKNGMKAMG
jgi:TolA-binding protein